MTPAIVQLKNPRSGRYVKIDRARGRLVSHKASAGPYRHVPIVVVGTCQNTPSGRSRAILGPAMADILTFTPPGSVQLLESRRTSAHSGKWEPGPGVTRDEAEAVAVAALTIRDRLIIRTLFCTGVRVGELVRFRPCDVVSAKVLRFPLEKNRSRHLSLIHI